VIAPLNLTFAQEPIRDAQWPAFRNRNRLDSSPENFAELMTAVATFLKPVVTAIHVDTRLVFAGTLPPWSLNPPSFIHIQLGTPDHESCYQKFL